jgi:hypothetical protein
VELSQGVVWQPIPGFVVVSAIGLANAWAAKIDCLNLIQTLNVQALEIDIAAV